MDAVSKAAGSLSVIVPVYNSEPILPQLVERLERVLDGLKRDYEIVLVNDASRDGSWGAIQNLCRDRRRVVGINLMRNYGQHNALLCGIRAARGGVVVTMDDDLQHPPEEIPTLLTALEERGVDVIYGRPAQEQHGLWRNMASRATKLAMERMIGATNARDISSFRAFRTRLRDGFAGFQSPFVSIDVLLTWSTAKLAAIEVRRDPRTVGKSNYNTWRLVVGTINVITAFSTLPLRAATFLGLVMALFGTAVLIFVVVSYALYGSNPGFPFLACIVAIFSGAQLLALGIIGEYLARIFLRSMGRPVYAVKEVAGRQAAAHSDSFSVHE